ncbi:amidohydrolase [Acetohalobium arabaticum]|uniref:Peptidase M20 domain-containing protein 2 n=1 Tax=Acetohalobium arabaticum (strain ATCC 49924 / DSM 5501 / Z-7288) TaxID=574087 RepID=D9QQC1_ACEAZ|nr:amidohydrolase [Acetohalobium arabaticum]ADL12712.1 amidohydrolase [Acetohalobium arabaticum DSM 5501]
MNKEELKQKICKVIDENRERIIAFNQKIYDNPELGYKETFSTEAISQELKDLGLKVKKDIAVTGCKGRIENQNPGPTIALLGELDSITCPEHPDADPETGAVHACGHNIQLSAMLGAAIGLVSSNVVNELEGNVEFIAVPAEEYVELEYRSKLLEEGKIKFFGGKQELIYQGELDNVDLAMMIHSLDLGDKKALIGGSGNGFVGKKVQFVGKESHAGSAPEEGVNALNGAMLAMSNIHAQRETFPEEEKVRVHPIITKGGDIVNVVPADVRIETYVRARTIEGIIDANKKVNRSLKAGAMAVGAEINISDMPGYLPLLTDTEFDTLFKSNLTKFIGENNIQEGASFTGSFDFGDVSHLMPSLHPFFGGVKGDIHTRDFRLDDPELAIITPAKTLATTIVDLLFDEAQTAKEIIDDFDPELTKEEYLGFLDGITRDIKEDFKD